VSSLVTSPRPLPATDRPRRYENFVIFLAPLLNSLAGIVVDLYAPSMPAIGYELHVSPATMQNTIAVTIVGYAFGQLFFGILSDWKGRRNSILLGLALFCLASVWAVGARSIETLMVARAVQGFAVGSCQVVARAILVDVVKGERFGISVIYLSVAFALGLIVGPYIGGAIQQWLGWRWNFVLYAAYGFIVLGVVLFGLRESLAREARYSPRHTIHGYREILGNAAFAISMVQLGCSFTAFTLWNQIGPYVVQNQLGHGPVFFGLTALAAGIAYFAGTLANRALIKRSSPDQRLRASAVIFLLGVLTIASSGTALNLLLITPGAMLCTFAQGVTFPNALARSLSLFPKRAGMAASLQGFGMLILGSGGLALASLPVASSGIVIAALYGVLLLVMTGTLVAGSRTAT
jgi:DHA1 family bicyclomycin/chloramphenicol resistance-like MFS transporter